MLNELTRGMILEAPRFGTVLLVDDHPIFRAGLATVLSRPGDGQVVLEAEGVLEAEQYLARHPQIGLILYDWHMPSLGGCRGLQRLRQTAPGVPVVVISADDDDAIGVAARQCGAVDVISKSTGAVTIRARLAALLGDLLPASTVNPPGRAKVGVDIAGLSVRQRDVLRLVACGYANKRIAGALGIREPTVRAHLTDIFRILSVRNRTEAALAAARQGLVGDDDHWH